jgi:phosphoribosyl-dephospho-CoA transferase
MFARIHDLLEIDVERFLQAQVEAPGWVAGSLRGAPFVVVRRGLVSTEQGISIGVRGTRRNERWAGVCYPDIVRAIVTPQGLLRRVVITPSARSAAIPALRSLPLLAERWSELKCDWGPGGSVGFELASGCHVVSPQSDLDVVIYAQTPIGTAEARALLDCAQGLPAAVDVRVETPICGFSLAEYANRAAAPILLRFASGPVLGTVPWAELGILGDQSGPAGSSRTA